MHAMKGYRTVKVYLKLIRIDGIRWDGQPRAPAALPPVERAQYLLNRRLGGSHSYS